MYTNNLPLTCEFILGLLPLNSGILLHQDISLTIFPSRVNLALGLFPPNSSIFLHQDISTGISINTYLYTRSLSPNRTSTIESPDFFLKILWGVHQSTIGSYTNCWECIIEARYLCAGKSLRENSSLNSSTYPVRHNFIKKLNLIGYELTWKY